MRWNLFKRLAFLGTVFIASIALGILASIISGSAVTYNWRSIQDFNRWKEWNMYAYIIGSVVISLPFITGMWYFRSGILEYDKRKQKRSSMTILFSVVLLILGLVEWFICARFNPNIPATLYSPYLTIFIVPFFLILVMFLSLVANDNYGLFDW